MEVEEVVKCGSLSVPPQGFLRQKKSWHKMYCVLYNSSRQGIQRLEVFDTEHQYLKQNKCLRIIGLSECLKVAPYPQKQQSNVFEIRTKESSNLFSSESFYEMTDWLNCLQSVAFGALPSHANHPNLNIRHSKGFPLDSNANHFNQINVLTLNNLNDTQSEDNLLYSSVDVPDVYRVKLIDSETSIRCGLRNAFDSNYTLVITSLNISLAEEGRVLFKWPYRHIRRYGCTKDGFSLEAGRKCVSGEGLFSFITKDGNYIFQAVASHVNSLKTSPLNDLNDDHILGLNSMSGHDVSPKVISKEIFFSSLQSSKPCLPLSPPPLSSSYSLKSDYLATNSSLLPSTRIGETTKRHSIQPPKSPQIIPKKSLARMPSVNTMIAISDIKPRTSPPISKPPRKSKESKTSESEEPVFASREDVMGLKPIDNDLVFNHKPVSDEVLYDELGEPHSNSDTQKKEQPIKSPFCPSPPPVNHTVSKLTSVLKMMFSDKRQNPKHKDKRVSSRSSTGSSGNTSVVSSPVGTTSAVEHIDSDDLSYAQIIDFIKDKNKSDVDFDNDSNHYSKILNDSSDGVEHHCEDQCKHQYANVVHKRINDLNKVSDSCDQNDSQTEHYVQNECEYARVVKRSMNNSSP